MKCLFLTSTPRSRTEFQGADRAEEVQAAGDRALQHALPLQPAQRREEQAAHGAGRVLPGHGQPRQDRPRRQGAGACTLAQHQWLRLRRHALPRPRGRRLAPDDLGSDRRHALQAGRQPDSALGNSRSRV